MKPISLYLSKRMPFFYGYAMLGLAFLATACSSPGQTFAISAFTPHLQESLSLSSSQLAGAYMLGTLLAAIPLTIIGPLSDRFGLRWTTVCVASALSLACWVISIATGFWSVLVGFLLLRWLGQGSLTLLSGNIVSMWFQRKLGTVNSVMSVGATLAFAIAPMVLLDSIESYGWRTTYALMGGVIFVVLVPPLILFLRNKPEELGLHPDGLSLAALDRAVDNAKQFAEPEFDLRSAVRHHTFWILATDMALWAMIGTGIVFYALQIFGASGIAPDGVKWMFVTFSLAMLAGQVAGGVLADRCRMHVLLAFGFLMLAIGAAIVPMTNSLLTMHCFAGFFGVGQGIAIAVTATMWVRYYGRKHLGKIRGAVWCLTVAGSGCGPLVLGVIHDTFGSFQPGLWLFVVLLSPLAFLSLWAQAPKWQEDEQDRAVLARAPDSPQNPTTLDKPAIDSPAINSPAGES